jgi:hypothetical protein
MECKHQTHGLSAISHALENTRRLELRDDLPRKMPSLRYRQTIFRW